MGQFDCSHFPMGDNVCDCTLMINAYFKIQHIIVIYRQTALMCKEIPSLPKLLPCMNFLIAGFAKSPVLLTVPLMYRRFGFR